VWTNDWRRNLIALSIGEMLSIAGFYFFTPLLPLFVQHLGSYGTTEAVQWAGVMAATSSLAAAAVQPAWGAMADRWGRKPMVIRSMLGGGATTLLMALATSPQVLLGMYTLQGIISGTVAASTALVAASVPKRHLGFALGILQVSVFVGASCGPLGGGLVADAFGYQAAFFVAAGLLIIGAVVVNNLVRESFTGPSNTTPRQSVWAEGRSLLGIGLFPLLLAVIFLIQFGNTTLNPVASLFIVSLTEGGNVATSVGLVMAATGAASAVSAFAIGRLGDRVGHKPVLLVSLAGAALSYFPQSMVQQVWQLLLLRMLLGAFLGGLMPSANALVAGIIPRERRGAAFGLTSSAMALSQAGGPVFGAGVATLWGLRAVFVTTGIIYSLAFLWAGLSLRTRAVSPPPEKTAGTATAKEVPPRVN
jgi:MFS transporter, DHA1 family, multidrug resistance protein